MGYNTVAFLLNDMAGSLKKSPKTVAWGLAHPPMCEHEVKSNEWLDKLDAVADENGEPRIHSQALEVIPTFHADDITFLRAGHNCIVELPIIKYGKSNGSKTVTLKLPEWA